MAVRTLQLCLVFAVGLFVGPVSAITGSNRAISVEPAPPISASPNQSPKYNVSLRFLEEPSDLVVPRNQNATLLCIAKSTAGNVNITWLYEGAPLADKDPRWKVKESELMVLGVTGGKRATTGSNTGDYSCLATNSFGSVLSRTAKVKIASMDKVVAVIAGNATTYESQPLLLHCSVHSNPPADIHWEFNNLPLPKDKRYVPLPNGALLLRDTKLNDSGNYRCLAENSIIIKKSKFSKDLAVTILPPSEERIAPFFLIVNSSVSQTVLIGETVEFLCIASGWPIPSVQWINNKNVTLSNSSILTIRNAHPKDSGNYTCVATNVQGGSTQKFHLDVFQKPYFNTTPISRVSPSAQTVRLDCQAKGIPHPKIMWLKNGKPLAPEIRIKKPWSGLVFSHTVSTDTGIYQCIAVNSVGRIWTAAQIEINNSQSPSPPQNVKCRPYDEDQICLTWTNPANVSVQAYSVYSSYTSEGSEVAGPEYLIQDTFQLAHGLKHSTNYTFYVRLYSNHASDHSEKVTCQTGLKGSRNLDIETISSTTVNLKWDDLSSDTLCNGTKDPYIVQWFRDGDDAHLATGITLERSFIVSGLLPATDYQFRVVTQSKLTQDEPWLLYSLPDIQDPENDTSEALGELRAPKYLHEDDTSSTSTKVSWARVSNAKFYTICYVPVIEDRECEEDDFVKSYSPKFSVLKLKPNTEYSLRVRAHDLNGVPGGMSQPLVIRTHADVPSPVIDLKFNALNSSTVCIYWKPPENTNGQLKKYLVGYTIDKNWSLEHLVNYDVPIVQNRSQICREDNSTGLVSTLLTNLSSEHTYLVMVRAANDFGVGKPCPPIIVKTFDATNQAGETRDGSEEVANNQKLGIILGVILAALCILCCITFILLRRRCLKRRALARARLTVSSSNYHPAVAHYTSQLGTVQVRMEEPCSMDEHEIEHLVSEDQSSHIPPVTPEHLDTKGANDLSNGYVNGISKQPRMNGGSFVNGHLHITENPQYYAFECNGNMAKNKSEPLLRHYEEDSNSNVKSSKYYFYKLFDNPKKYNKESPLPGSLCSKSIGSCRENALNSTQLTFLDDSMASQRRLSPVLEPNG